MKRVTRHAMALLFTVGVSMIGDAAQQQKPSGGIDVCAVLPRDEASKILGVTVRTRPRARPEGTTECRYSGGLDLTITVVVGGSLPKAKWDASMKELRAAGAVLEPVTGVGDGANFWDDRLYAHTGDYEVVVSTSAEPGAVSATTRKNAVALAKAIIAKLNAMPKKSGDL